jgi:hypothetical protein
MPISKPKKAKSGAYYITLSDGRTQFVKKPGRPKKKRPYKKSKLAFWRRG